MISKIKLKEFIIPKLKFASTSAIATAVEYILFFIFRDVFHIDKRLAQAISYTFGMITNFILQKKFVFKLNRKVRYAFLLSVSFSLIGWILNNAIFNILIENIDILDKYNIIAKMIATGIIFLYNFYTKRFAFEKKIKNI